MTTPKLIVVGSGRSGTKSLARLLDGAHEPNLRPTVYLAMARSHGWLSDKAIATVLSNWSYPEIISDHKQSELIDVTSQLWPDCKYLWIARNPADSVASMVQKRWYLPTDDNYPPGVLAFWLESDGVIQEMAATNHTGNRTRGDLVGQFSPTEWAAMSQVERCGWWWNYSNRIIATQFERLDPERCVTVKLEDIGPWFTEPLGHPDLPIENEGASPPVTGWEPYVTQMADLLGYEVDQ